MSPPIKTSVLILVISVRLLALKKCQLFSPSLLLSSPNLSLTFYANFNPIEPLLTAKEPGLQPNPLQKMQKFVFSTQSFLLSARILLRFIPYFNPLPSTNSLRFPVILNAVKNLILNRLQAPGCI
jgi:hypothetical protein